MDLLAIHLQVKEWILTAGDLIKTEVKKGITVSEKSSRQDVVTNLDRMIEEFLITRIRQAYPTHQIVSEEGFGHHVTNLNGYTWFIDPIDGTMNFVQQRRNFAVMVALYYNGEAQLGYIYDVMRDEFVFSIAGYGAYQNDIRLPLVEQKDITQGILHMNGSMILNATPQIKSLINRSLGTRTVGAAALNHLAVIRGEAIAYLALRLSPWDLAAGMAIGKEVGIEFCDIRGQAIDLLQETSSVIVTNQTAQSELLEVCQSLVPQVTTSI